MKCLENLSLVPDECLEDLQKDIEKVVLSYTNLGEFCENKFREIKNKMHTYHIDSICKILVDSETFHSMPVAITQSGWEKYAIKFFNFGGNNTDEDVKKSLVELFGAFERRTIDCAFYLDIENDINWLWRDGANWDLHLDYHDDFLDILEAQIAYELPETQLKLLKTLQKIEKQL